MEEWLKVSEAAEETGIPARTIHRYIKRHPDFLPVREEHRTKLIRVEDLPVLRRIRRLYQEGNPQERVEELLEQGEEINRTLTIQKDDDTLPEAFGLLKDMVEQQENMAEEQ